MEGDNSSRICKICNVASTKYTCPKCNISFCSVNCYKNVQHLECSESFYRNCIVTELQSYERDKTMKNNMYDILKRVHQQQCEDINFESNNNDLSDPDSDDDDDDDLSIDIQKRFENVNLDDPEEIWNKLNNDERQQFEALIHSGQIQQLIPQWTPWWCLQTYKLPVEELNQSTEAEYIKNCPIVKDVPDFSVISRKTPAECIKYNIINVLASYAYTLRIYNGEPYDCLNESVFLLTFISNNLKSNKNYSDLDDAVHDIIPEVINCPLKVSVDDEFFNEIKADCIKLIKGPKLSDKSYYVKSALSDIYKMMISSKKNKNINKKTHKTGEFSKKFSELEIFEISKEQLKLHIKKIEYYMSYVKSYGLNIYNLE